MKQTIEMMTDFFTVRADGYDDHMLNNVEGCREAYIELARLLPAKVSDLLDLGCGTGLELAKIFIKYPDIKVTGIDLTQAMLDKLKEKYYDKSVNLICGSYFNVDFGIEIFDAAVSFQTMHHFSHEEKEKLYTKIKDALKPGGLYIECDYMVTEQTEEDYFYAENRRIRTEQGILEDEFYHYDTPCTVGNQLNMFLTAGFKKAEQVWRKGNTTIIIGSNG